MNKSLENVVVKEGISIKRSMMFITKAIAWVIFIRWNSSYWAKTKGLYMHNDLIELKGK